MRRLAKIALVVVLMWAVTGAWAAVIPIEGRVVGSEGRPLAEVEVTLRQAIDPATRGAMILADSRPQAASKSRTDVDGRFLVEAPSAGHWVVRVDAPGHVPVELSLVGLLERADLPDARLVPDVGLTVRLLTQDSAPLEDGLVWLSLKRTRRGIFGEREWETALRAGFTGPEGTIRLPRGQGEATVVSASSFGRRFVERRVTQGTALTLEMPDAALRTLEIRSAEGRPEPDTLVRFGDPRHPVGFTDDSGRIDLPAPTRGEIPVRLDAVDGRALQTRLSATKPDEEPEVFVLPDRASVRGRLIDANTRRPIAGGLVWDQGRIWDAAVTDGSGGFVLYGPLNHGMYINARAPGYLPTRITRHTLDDSDRRGPTLALEPAAAIEGIVVDENGDPVADAEISLEKKTTGQGMMIEIEFGEGGLPSTQTGSRGRFRLSAVDPENDYILRAHAEGYGPAKEEIKGLRPYDVLSGRRIVLRRGQTVTGLVVDQDGNAISDARIKATESPVRESGAMRVMSWGGGGSPEAPSFEGVTDVEGVFEISGLSPGLHDLEIRRSGFAKRSAQGLEVVEGEDPADLGEFALEPGERLQGRVVDPDGGVIEGAEIRLTEGGGGMIMMGPGPVELAPDAVTGPDGWFAVEDLAPGVTVDVSAGRSGYVSGSKKAVRVPAPEFLEIELHPSSKVSGTVQDEEGTGIPGAQVNLRRMTRMEMGGNVAMAITMEQAQADSEGWFEFEDVQPGEISLSAVASGWQEAKLDAVEVPKGEDLTDVALTLKPGSVVVGRVTTPDGRGAIQATVSKVDDQPGMIRGLDGAFTDGDGYYRLEGMAPGQISIQATHDDHPRVVRDIEIDEGANTLDFQFEGGLEVSGYVMDEAGNPVASAWVRLAARGRLWGGSGEETDGNGSFAFSGVRDGEYTISAGAEGFAATEDEQTVTVEGQPVSGLQVTLAPGGTVTGKVHGVQPEDYRRVEIRAERAGRPGWGNAVVDHEGHYSITDLAPGSWELTATLGDTGRQATGRVELAAGASEEYLDLEFGLGLVLSGTVVEGRDPVVGATVFAAGRDIERTGWARTDADGAFRIEGLERGSYNVDVRNWSTGMSYEETVELTSSQEITLRIPTARVSGQIIDSASREGVAGVAVNLETAGDSDHRGFFQSHGATTDLEGKFVIDFVGEGVWRLAATKSGYAATTQDVQVQRSRDLDSLRIMMDPTEGLSLEVRLPSGQPPDEAHIAVLGASGGTLISGRYATGENGTVRLTTVPPGTWDVLAGADGTATTRVSATAPGGSNRIALLPATGLDLLVPDLVGTGTIATVRVVGSDGRPHASLAWFGSTASEWRMSDGRMEFRSLPPGSWTVRVTTPDGGAWEGMATTSPGAPAQLTLE